MSIKNYIPNHIKMALIIITFSIYLFQNKLFCQEGYNIYKLSEYISSCHDLALKDSILFVADGQISALDISNSSDPFLLKKFGKGYSISIRDNKLASLYGNNLYIYNIQNAYSPELLGEIRIYIGGITPKVRTVKSHCFIGYENGVKIIDISDPLNIFVADTIAIEEPVTDLFVSEKYLYFIGSGRAGFFIYDISNLDQLHLVSSLPISGTKGIWVVDDRVYLARGFYGVSIYDVLDITNPKYNGSFNTDGAAMQLTSDGRYIYVADGSGGVKVLDALDTKNIIQMGTYRMNNARYILNKDNIIYAANTPPGDDKKVYILNYNEHSEPIDSTEVIQLIRDLYRINLGYEIIFPVIHRYRNAWVNTAYLNDMLVRYYVFDDGSYSSKVSKYDKDVYKPNRCFKVLVVFLDNFTTNIAELLIAEWPIVQDSINNKYINYAQEIGLADPIVSFNNTNIYITYDELGNMDWLDYITNMLYIDTSAYDIIVRANFDADNPRGCGASIGRLKPAFVYMEYYGEAAMNLYNWGSTLYDHEIGHLFGWEHEWGPSERKGFITRTDFLGWQDIDGDGIIEIFDNTPYGSKIVPVELSSFTISLDRDNVLISWSTESESNNYGFKIQRSTNNINFVRIAFIKGQGTTLIKNFYSYKDTIVADKPEMYYRLKQIDFDGTFTYSNTIKIVLNLPEVFSLLQNYPNPFNNQTVIKYQLHKDADVTLTIFNIRGELVKTLINDERQKVGYYRIQWDTRDENGDSVAGGLYLYQLKTDDFSKLNKMVLIK